MYMGKVTSFQNKEGGMVIGNAMILNAPPHTYSSSKANTLYLPFTFLVCDVFF